MTKIDPNGLKKAPVPKSLNGLAYYRGGGLKVLVTSNGVSILGDDGHPVMSHHHATAGLLSTGEVKSLVASMLLTLTQTPQQAPRASTPIPAFSMGRGLSQRAFRRQKFA